MCIFLVGDKRWHNLPCVFSSPMMWQKTMYLHNFYADKYSHSWGHGLVISNQPCLNNGLHLSSSPMSFTDVRRNNNVIMTSMRRHDVVLASGWCYHCVICPLGVLEWVVSGVYPGIYTIFFPSTRFKYDSRRVFTVGTIIVQFGTCDLWKYHHNFAVGNQTNTWFK